MVFNRPRKVFLFGPHREPHKLRLRAQFVQLALIRGPQIRPELRQAVSAQCVPVVACRD
jgi:hypothetical protein